MKHQKQYAELERIKQTYHVSDEASLEYGKLFEELVDKLNEDGLWERIKRVFKK